MSVLLAARLLSVRRYGPSADTSEHSLGRRNRSTNDWLGVLRCKRLPQLIDQCVLVEALPADLLLQSTELVSHLINLRHAARKLIYLSLVQLTP